MRRVTADQKDRTKHPSDPLKRDTAFPLNMPRIDNRHACRVHYCERRFPPQKSFLRQNESLPGQSSACHAILVVHWKWHDVVVTSVVVAIHYSLSSKLWMGSIAGIFFIVHGHWSRIGPIVINRARTQENKFS